MYNITIIYVCSHGFPYDNLISLYVFSRKFKTLHSLVLYSILYSPKIYIIMNGMYETTFDFPVLLINNKHL